MLNVSIPDFGEVAIHSLVLDFTGTLSEFGKLVPGVAQLLDQIAGCGVQVHVLTSDTFKRAQGELAGVNAAVTILTGADHHLQKKAKVVELGADGVIAIGNGRNDREMLAAARIGICVLLAEGAALQALSAADVVHRSIVDALGCLLPPDNINALKATLRS